MTVPLPLLIDHVRAAASMETGAVGALAAEGVRQLEAMRFARAVEAIRSVITAHEDGTVTAPGIRLWRGLHGRLCKAINALWAYQLVDDFAFDLGCRGTVITGTVGVLIGIDGLGVMLSDGVPFEYADGEVRLHHERAPLLPDAVGPTSGADLAPPKWWEHVAADMNRKAGHSVRTRWANYQATVDVRGAVFKVEKADVVAGDAVRIDGDLILGTSSTPLDITIRRTAFGVEVPLGGVAAAMAAHYDAGLVDGMAITRIANELRYLVRGEPK